MAVEEATAAEAAVVVAAAKAPQSPLQTARFR